MGQLCDIIDTDTGLWIAQGYIRSMAKVAIVEIPNLKQYDLLHKPLKRLQLNIKEHTDLVHGLVYSSSVGTNTCIINIISASSVERRNKHRIDLGQLVSLEVGLGTQVSNIQAGILNISQGGMAFSYAETVRLGNTVRYEFQHENHRSILMGKVMWARPDGNGYAHGVKFSHMTHVQERALHDFVMSHIKELQMN
jgi:hypothetical protein